MSTSNLSSPRNVKLGAIAAPVLFVCGLALMSNVAEPHSAAADVQAPPDPQAMLIASMGGLTEAQRAAMAFRSQIPVLTETDSPFPLIEEIRQVTDDPDVVEDPYPSQANGHEVMVSTVMSSRSGNIALINGKPHREGDQLGGVWTIRTIDASAKHIIVQASGGQPVTIGLNKPTMLPAR